MHRQIKKVGVFPSELKSGGENIPDEPHDLDFLLGRRHKEHPYTFLHLLIYISFSE